MAVKFQGGRAVPVVQSQKDQRDLQVIRESLAEAKKAMTRASATLNAAIQRQGAFARAGIHDEVTRAFEAVYSAENAAALMKLQ